MYAYDFQSATSPLAHSTMQRHSSKGQYIPESIDKTYNTRIREFPFPRYANASASSDRSVYRIYFLIIEPIL